MSRVLPMPPPPHALLGIALFLAACVVPNAVLQQVLDQDADNAVSARAGGPDCNDHNAKISPSTPERCMNEVDDDCDGLIDEGGLGALPVWPDLDGDDAGDIAAQPTLRCRLGLAEAPTSNDCNDNRADIKPGAFEICNGVDDNCDGTIDEGYALFPYYVDHDQDGWGDAHQPIGLCGATPGVTKLAGDCNDTNPNVHPLAADIPYDDLDADCAGNSDFDVDTDGYEASPYGGDDCDDSAVLTHPGAFDPPYDGIDADCLDNDDYDADSDGERDHRHGGLDCNDGDASVHTLAVDTPYDGIDADCDGDDDFDVDRDGIRAPQGSGNDCDDHNQLIGAPHAWYSDDDNDGWGLLDGATPQPSCAPPQDGHWSAKTGDCDDSQPLAYPGALESQNACDGIDQDCDGVVDDGLGHVWWLDQDGDGWGYTPTAIGPLCDQPLSFVAAPGDCDDHASTTYPTAPEICGSIVRDCVIGNEPVCDSGAL